MEINIIILNSLLVVLASIMLDTVMGILVSIKNKTFNINKLPQYLATNVFPYIGGLIIIALMANYIKELEYLFYAGIGFATLKFSKEALIDKARILFS